MASAVGGWPTEFADSPPNPRLPRLVAAFYDSQRPRFLALANQGHNPSVDFFDSQGHLLEECQAKHSIAVARVLGMLLGRPAAGLAA